MMEAWANQAGSSCAVAVVPAEKRSHRIRKIASGGVFWIGMGLIGIVAIPAGILLGLISLLVRITGLLTDWLDGD